MTKQNPLLTSLTRQLADGRLSRREFLRFATLIGLAAPAAYAMIGEAPARGRAAGMPQRRHAAPVLPCARPEQPARLFLGRGDRQPDGRVSDAD